MQRHLIAWSGWIVAFALLLTHCENTTEERLHAIDVAQLRVGGASGGAAKGEVTIADGVIRVRDDAGHTTVIDARGVRSEGSAEGGK